MSPVPPPVGSFVPSDDWTDDPSFEISPTSQHFALPSSPSSSSSTSTKSRHSLSSVRAHASSPLRQSFTGSKPARSPSKQDEIEEDDGLDFAELPDSFPALPSPRNSTSVRPRSSTASSTSSLLNLSHTVIGHGPLGVGTITHLGAAPSGFPAGTVKARAKAIEKAWEADVDFDVVEERQMVGKDRQLKLSSPKKRIMPSADALDDLGFDFDDEDKQATLKAGGTLKAMLPPPRPKPAVTTPPMQDADVDEDDLVLPLNLTNLTLATQPAGLIGKSHPWQSNASTVNTDWDSPSTSTSGKKSGGFWGSEDSPLGKTSETSVTSMSDGFGASSGCTKGVNGKDDEVEEEEDMESGLVLPSPTFFSNRRTKELNSILDRKRKPQFAPMTHTRAGTDDSLRMADESMEDGLVLEDPKLELSHQRLRHSRRSRNVGTPAGQPPRKVSGGAKSVAKEREKAWERQREQGWGRHTPLPPSSRERTQSTLGLSGLRSHSASATQMVKDSASSFRRPESPLVFSRERETPRAPSRTQSSMGPPPVPPPASSTVAPSAASRLRHQKSYYHMPPPQSPSLTRKQSLASLQDALSQPVPELPTHLETPSSSRYHSTSRLTMPTSSSRAKIRPPISSVFPRPEFSHSSSGSSMSATNLYGQLTTPIARKTKMVEMPRRTKAWGDGTELEGIEDLMVDEEPKGPANIGLGKPNRRGHEPPHSKTPPQKTMEEKRKKSGSGSTIKRNRNRKPALLIKHLGGVDRKKVVGEMTWNPQTLRWEGNEAVLRDFDIANIASSSRPALIAHYTGSSVGGVTSPSAAAPSATVRIVGDMKFDPERMCWVSLTEEEPDPFEGMADDEDEDVGATITRASGRKLVSVGLSSSATSAWSSRLASESSAAASVMSWEERVRAEVPRELWAECKEAEERHRREVKGWVMRTPSGSADLRERERREEKRLWEIRNLALKS